MTACDRVVPNAFPHLPTYPELQGVLHQVQKATRVLHTEVDDKIVELSSALATARAAGNALQSRGFLDNPVAGWVGARLVDAVDGLHPKIRAVSADLQEVVDGLEIATRGAGNPNRIAAIAEALRSGVGDSLVGLADDVAISQLETSRGWDSPAAGAYFARADDQSTFGMRPLAAEVLSMADVLDRYAESQIEYAELVEGFFWTFARFCASLGLTLAGTALTVTSLVGDGGTLSPLDGVGIAGACVTCLTILDTVYSFARLLDDVAVIHAAPREPCERVAADLSASHEAVNFAWPPFATE